MYNYSKLTFSELIEKIGKSRFFNLPKMLEEAFKRLPTNESIARQVVATTETEYEIIPTSSVIMLTLEEGVETVILPPVEGNDGVIIFLTNDAGADIALESNLGQNEIWEGGLLSNESTVPLGSVLRLINDSKKWRIL